MMKCPGCSKRCCENAPRCKYGRAYFARQQQKREGDVRSKSYKWEKHLTRGGLIWQMLMTNRRMKKAVCKAAVTENELTAQLTQAECELMSDLLKKLEQALPLEK